MLAVVAASSASPSNLRGGTREPYPLTVFEAPTPRLQVPRYHTSGEYPQVRDWALDLDEVNKGLLDALRADQRDYTPSARRHARSAPPSYRGIYRTTVDRRLLSASSVVVSAMLPAVQLYPGGTGGRGWVPMTVRVPSGRRVTISDLFADPPRGLAVLARASTSKLRRSQFARCLELISSDLRPTARNYRYFALTARGLAVGFWQPPACDRLQTIVAYSVVLPQLSQLGRALVAGVRTPRP